MAYCPYCGEKNREDAKFCRKCGKALQVTGDKLIGHEIIHRQRKSTAPTLYKRGEYEVFEWNVVIIAALIVIISFGVLRRFLPSLALWIGIILSFIYIILATKKKSSAIFLMIMTFIVALVIKAFFT